MSHIFSSTWHRTGLGFAVSASSWNTAQTFVSVQYLVWPAYILIDWLTFPLSYIWPCGRRIQMLKEFPVLIHLQKSCREPLVFQPWNFSYYRMPPGISAGTGNCKSRKSNSLLISIFFFFFQLVVELQWPRKCHRPAQGTLSSAPSDGPLTRMKCSDRV